MIVGSKISCVGIVGDGCGGGREFIVQDGVLSAYDPQSKESIELLKDVINPQKISKSGCIITIKCENKTIEFDLSKINEK